MHRGNRFLPAIAAIALASIPCSQAWADPCLGQINEDGFGNAKNSYAFAMKAFGDYLYVGTLNHGIAGQIDDLDSPDPRPTPKQSQPGVTGTQIWRFDGLDWSQVVGDGFGTRNNEGTRSMAVYKNALYAGTVNARDGLEVWRSSDGATWKSVAKHGFGDPANYSVRSMTTWRKKLWVGTVNARGGELWSYDGSTWARVIAGGIANGRNYALSDLRVSQDRLLVSTWNLDGAEMYQFDGSNWTQLVGGSAAARAGFGDVTNTGIFSTAEFHGALYASTRNYDKGFALWKSKDLGKTWKPVITNGMGDSTQKFGWTLLVHDDQLFIGTLVLGTGETERSLLGGRVYRSPDGTTWGEDVGPNGRLAPPGFGHNLNYGVRTLESFFGELYIGTAQSFVSKQTTGAEVWKRNSAECED